MRKHPVGPETKPLNSSGTMGEAHLLVVAVMAAKPAKRAGGSAGHASRFNSIGFPHSLGRVPPIADRQRTASRSGSRAGIQWQLSGAQKDIGLPSARVSARLNSGLRVHGVEEMLAALFKNFIRERRANVCNSTRKQQHTDHLA